MRNVAVVTCNAFQVLIGARVPRAHRGAFSGALSVQRVAQSFDITSLPIRWNAGADGEHLRS